MVSLSHAPAEVLGALSLLKSKTIDNVSEYFDHSCPYAPNLGIDVLNDSTVPACSNSFIQERDRTSIVWTGEKTLEQCVLSNVQHVHRPGYSVQKILRDWLLSLPEFSGQKFQNISGRFYYPAGGYMGWHTNSNTPGKRVYLAYASGTSSSFFRYYDNETGEVATDWDAKGWNIRAFDIVNDPTKYYWHCVYAAKPRWSFGFHFTQ